VLFGENGVSSASYEIDAFHDGRALSSRSRRGGGLEVPLFVSRVIEPVVGPSPRPATAVPRSLYCAGSV
jgi:hypothetical protein